MASNKLWILLALPTLVLAQRSAADLESFDRVWTTIRDTHWQKEMPGGLDWDAIREEYRPRVEAAQSSEEARAAMVEMLGRLKQTHFGIFSGSVIESLEDDGGPGTTGVDLRAIGGEAVVVSVDPGSPAERSGVKPGWVIRAANGREVKPLPLPELQGTRALLARISGPIGGSIEITFDPGGTKRLDLIAGRGTFAALGNLPPMRLWYEDKRLGGVAYVRFNAFLDIPRIMPAFEKSVRGCAPCDGLIIDLRGNPGGIGGMAMGMAGFLVQQPNQRLGTMYMRDATLNFVINPRPPVFQGPVAVLMDGTSASTAEIFAGGLQDLKRARVFGTTSAAAALPSIFTTLPNGDGFQYAIANYISQGGNALEGRGVPPDEVVELTRESLLRGHDAVVDAALAWITAQKAGITQ